jgi:hypothetical protein
MYNPYLFIHELPLHFFAHQMVQARDSDLMGACWTALSVAMENISLPYVTSFVFNMQI